MPPRILPRPQALRLLIKPAVCPACHVRCASVATTPAPSPSFDSFTSIARHPPTQPPSHKHPALRKSQLHRQYQSLLRSSPIIIIFQHNNLKAAEWIAIRRQLVLALAAVSPGDSPESARDATISAETKIHILNTGIFESALKVVEFWTPPGASGKSKAAAAAAADIDTLSQHGLSQNAWRWSNHFAKTRRHGLEPLLSGPLAALSFPAVSPAHVAAALRILSPGEGFAAPKRKAAPDYYEPEVQGGLQKLMLLGARVDGKAMDIDGVRWVGGIEGGLAGLRAQIVGLLSSAGMGLASALEGAGRSLYMTVEGRRMALEEEGKSQPDAEAAKDVATKSPAP